MSNDLEKITNFDIYNELLIQFFKDKEKFVQVQEAISKQCQYIENAIFEFLDAFDLETAIGNQLDIIGNWVGISREGRNDTEYREVIRVKIAINNGSGEHETIIRAITGIYGASNVQLIYLGNANLQISTDVILTSTDYQYLLEIIAAGVGLFLTVGRGIPFVFLNDPDGYGFGKLFDSILSVDFGSGEEDLLIDTGSILDTMSIIINDSYPIPVLDILSVDFGSGEEDLLVDFGNGETELEIIYGESGDNNGGGGELQAIIS